MDILEISVVFTLQAPTPQNGQKDSHSSSAKLTNCLNVFDHFVGLVLKGLISYSYTCKSSNLFRHGRSHHLSLSQRCET